VLVLVEHPLELGAAASQLGSGGVLSALDRGDAVANGVHLSSDGVGFSSRVCFVCVKPAAEPGEILSILGRLLGVGRSGGALALEKSPYHQRHKAQNARHHDEHQAKDGGWDGLGG
jgi:hypothetical protein